MLKLVMVKEQEQNINTSRSAALRWPLVAAAGTVVLCTVASLGAAGLYGFWEGGGKELVTQAYYSCQGSDPGGIAMQLSLHAASQPPPVQDFLNNIYCTARTVAGNGIVGAIGLALQYWARQLGPREHNI